MSLATIHSRAQFGLNAPPVTVEVHIGDGLPRLQIVGLPEAALRESGARVRGALASAGFDFPDGRITVSLAPADLPKAGSRYDLAIAIGMLVASGQLPHARVAEHELVAELGLGGELRSVGGVVPTAIHSRDSGRALLVAHDDAGEAGAVDNAVVYGARSLLEACAHLCDREPLAAVTAGPADATRSAEPGPDLADVAGQLEARRALEIAAAGHHNLLLVGPPGTGKTMLAQRLLGLLPAMDDATSLELAAVRSVARGRSGATEVRNGHAWRQRPLRAPHHTSTQVALVGGGNPPMPGEISLAHGGVLFLDELPEFGRRVLEVLREPLETGTATVARAAWRAEFPARFQLVAAMNPCPCGHYGDGSRRCACSDGKVRNYRERISGPLLDRIDLQAETAPTHVDWSATPACAGTPETTAIVRQRVLAARLRATQRQGVPNAELAGAALAAHCRLDAAGDKLLENACRQFFLSARGHTRVLRLARTIADLAQADGVQPDHLAEALGRRQLSRFSAT